MLLRAWQRCLNLKSFSMKPARRRRAATLNVECLEARIVPAVNVTDAAAFSVSITGDETVAIGVTGGKVVVTVNGVAAMQTTNAASVTSLTITASGNFANRIDLQGVTAGGFSSLAGTSVNGGSGNDVIIGSALVDTLNGGSGNDTLLGLGGADSLLGGSSNDVLIGGAGDDRLEGGTGNDTLSGEEDSDVCLGGDGADKISGGSGADNVNGQAGNDSLSGDDGNDYVLGGAGVDTLSGGLGDDMVKGQGGRDVIQGSQQAVLQEAQAFANAILAGNPPGTPQLPDDATKEYQPSLDFSTNFIPDGKKFLVV